MAATVFAEEGAAAARGGCSAECASGGGPDLGGSRAARAAGDGGKRSVYLMECVPLWGCAATRGHAAEMEDACAAVPRFADVPVRMLASTREMDGIGVDFDASELRLPAHLFGVYDGHGGSEVRLSSSIILGPDETHLALKASRSRFMLSVQVANYCRDKIHVVLRDVLGADNGFGEVGEVDVKEPWEKVFGDCFQKVDDEVSGKASMFPSGSREPRAAEPVAADNVGSTAVVAVVCSSHVIAANCGDSRVVLCRGKEPIALSVDHKVQTGTHSSTMFGVSDYVSVF
jgi:protein phosphatase 2C